MMIKWNTIKIKDDFEEETGAISIYKKENNKFILISKSIEEYKMSIIYYEFLDDDVFKSIKIKLDNNKPFEYNAYVDNDTIVIRINNILEEIKNSKQMKIVVEDNYGYSHLATFELTDFKEKIDLVKEED